MKNKLIKLLIIMSISLITSQALQFPVTPWGQCYEGVQIMESYYHENGIATSISYINWISNEYPGHVWLQVGPDRQIMDSYYGPITNEGEYGFPKWFSPDKTFNNFF